MPRTIRRLCFTSVRTLTAHVVPAGRGCRDPGLLVVLAAIWLALPSCSPPKGLKETPQTKPSATSAGQTSVDPVAALATERNDATRLLMPGHLAYLGGDLDRAVEAWTNIYRESERKDDMKYLQARCHQEIGSACLFPVRIELRQSAGTPTSGAVIRSSTPTTDACRLEQSLNHLDIALTMYKSIPGTAPEQADCNFDLGLVAAHGGKPEFVQAAAYHFEQALAAYTALSEAQRPDLDLRLAQCYGLLSSVLGQLAQHGTSLALSEKAQARFAVLGPSHARDAAIARLNMAHSLMGLGYCDRATEQANQALAAFRQVPGSEEFQADCSLVIADALLGSGRHQDALQRYQEALRTFQTLPAAKGGQEACKIGIGDAYCRAGLFSQAIDQYATILHSGSSPRLLQALGNAFRRRGEEGDALNALAAFWQAICATQQDLAALAPFEYRVAGFEKESTVFRDLVGLLAASHERRIALELPDLFHDIAKGSPSPLLEIAFDVADTGKSRALGMAIQEVAYSPARDLESSLQAKEKQLSQQISKLTATREQLPAADGQQRNALLGQIEELQRQQNALQVERGWQMARARQFRATTIYSHSLDRRRLPPRTAVLQYSIGAEEAWVLTATQAELFAHRIPCTVADVAGRLSQMEVPLPELNRTWKQSPQSVGLNGLVRLVRSQVEHHDRIQPGETIDGKDQPQILEKLGDALLPDAALAALRKQDIRHLVVIADGPLYYLPFAMLRVPAYEGSGRRYLIEEFAVSYIPAVTTLKAIRDRQAEREKRRTVPRRELLAFANPEYPGSPMPAADDMLTRLRDFRSNYYCNGGLHLTSLPETEREARRAASLFSPVSYCASLAEKEPEGTVVVCTKGAACEEQVKRLLRSGAGIVRWRYVLFSAHGFADLQNGMLSCIVLSSPGERSTDDGFLQAQEVLDLELDTDVVMLSACQTGLGRLRAGEGVVGLSAAFFVAGAESVCATLWQVPTGPTSQLVAEFFRHLKEGEVNRAEALRQAQLTVMRRGQDPNGKLADYSDPFCWAAFILNGEWQ